MGKSHFAPAPDVPTTDEAGAPGLHMTFWYGFWAPAGTPKPIIARLQAAVIEAFANPAVQQRLTDQAWSFRRASSKRRRRCAHHKAEIEKWWPMIKAAGIKVQ